MSPFGQKIGTFFVRTGCRLRCSRGKDDARRVGYIGEGGSGAGAASLSASPMPHSLVTFLAGQESNIHCTLDFLQSKISPQPLWNVENFPVENLELKFLSTGAVEKLLFSTFALWIKKRCGRNAKGSFPHNFVLRLLRLKNL